MGKDRGGQKASQIATGLTDIAWGTTLGLFFIAWSIVMAQAYFNYKRKSTIGWSIGNIILDITGGLSNFAQMGVKSIDQYLVQNFTRNVGKIGLTLESVLFYVLFILQHYVLYPTTESMVDEYQEIEEADPVSAS